MELKEQLSDLRYQTSVLINKIKELEQQINKPKIEVKEEKLFTKQEVAVILEDYRKFTWNNGATKSDLELWIKENIA
jgi:hypothetical protein